MERVPVVDDGDAPVTESNIFDPPIEVARHEGETGRPHRVLRAAGAIVDPFRGLILVQAQVRPVGGRP